MKNESLLIHDSWVSFKGVLHPNQKLACFVLYLKIINTILENHIYASYSKSSKGEKKKKKKSRPSVFKLWIKTVKMLFVSINQELLGLPKFWCYFWVPWTIYNKMHIEMCWWFWESTKHANFWLGVQVGLLRLGQINKLCISYTLEINQL